MPETETTKPSLWAYEIALDLWVDAHLCPWTKARERMALKLDRIVAEAERRGALSFGKTRKPADGDLSESVRADTANAVNTMEKNPTNSQSGS